MRAEPGATIRRRRKSLHCLAWTRRSECPLQDSSCETGFDHGAAAVAQIHRRTWLVYALKVAPNCRRIFDSSNGICTQFAVANRSTGTANIGSDPTTKPTPNVSTTSPKYIGFRVKRYGPRMTSDLFVSEVGLSSVPSTRNSEAAQNARPRPTAIRAAPSQTTRRSINRRQGYIQLAAAAAIR